MKTNLLKFLTLISRSVRDRRFAVSLIGGASVLISMYFVGATNTQTQVFSSRNDNKIVEKHPSGAKEPLEITQLRVSDREIELGNEFDEKGDWIKDLIITVRNSSDKPITFIHIDLDFPDTREMGGMMAHQIVLGYRKDFRSTHKNPRLSIQPGDEMEIPLESRYGDIKRLVELRHPSISIVSKIVIRLTEVMFDDGMLYSAGTYYTRNPDPKDTRKWIPITKRNN